MRSHFSLDTDTDTGLFEQDPSFGTAFHKSFFNFSPNLLNGRIDEDRARSKQSL